MGADNDVSVLKLRIKALESSNRSLLDRVKNQAELLADVDDVLQEAEFKFKIATGMVSGMRELIKEKGIERITVDDN